MGSQEESIRLIQLYSKYNALWDPKDPKYLNKNQREDSWRQISAQINMPVKEVKNKMVSLCGSYRREKSREKKSRITGAADVYNSKWFGYPYFHFLKDKNETGDTQETMPNAAMPESSQTSDVERHTETENAPTKSQLPEASIEEAPLQQQQDLDSEASMSSPSEPARKKKRHNPKKAQPQEDSVDIMLAEALECLQQSSTDITDPYSSFGRHIANELRKYDPHTLAYVKNAINNIIFEADIGKYTQQQINTGY
ncbi:hypothetical protein RR48_02578 [Papilio machaon]|uniref:MADF domain-containing protein n=1 Tax=Papilio machaon TaxID=76193 RepID=A0A0N1PJ65_PAPMA|nr:hypothetical protein RR48_02578 [Papilio machaon]